MADWQELATTSHYQTAVAVRDELEAGHYADAKRGLEELIDALSRSEKRGLKSQLIRLMTHVYKWESQPERRSSSWAATIADARHEIQDIQEETPSLTDDVVRAMWDRCVARARQQAKIETNRQTSKGSLTWEEVFEAPYEFEADAT